MHSRRSTQTTGFGQGLYTPSPPHTHSYPLCYGPLIYVLGVCTLPRLPTPTLTHCVMVPLSMCSGSVHSLTSPHPLLPIVLWSPYLCVLGVGTLPRLPTPTLTHCVMVPLSMCARGRYTPSPPHTHSYPLCYGPLIYVCSGSVHSLASPHPLLPIVLWSPYLFVLGVCTLPPPPHTHSYPLCYGPLICVCSVSVHSLTSPHPLLPIVLWSPYLFVLWVCTLPHLPIPTLVCTPYLCVCSVSVHSPHLPIPTLAHCTTVPRVSWSNFYLKIVG